MMKTIFFIVTLFAIFNLKAGEHSLHAHEHGAVKMSMAVEKKLIEIDLDGPAESFLGFEYIPKTSNEKKIFANLEALWMKNLESLIAFDKKLKCKVDEASFKQVVDEKETTKKTKETKDSGVHSDIEAKAKILCASDVGGSMVSISLIKAFKNIKKLSIEVIGNETKSVEILSPVQIFKI